MVQALEMTGDAPGADDASHDAVERRASDLQGAAFRFSPVMMVVCDAGDGRIVDANEAFADACGRSLDEILRRTLGGIDVWDGPEQRAIVTSLLDGTRAVRSAPVRMRLRTGEVVDVLVSSRVVDDDVSYRFVALADVSELSRSIERLERDALFDPLTGLANRTTFEARLRQALGHASRRASYRFAVLFLDLDHFKNVNDRFGHLEGDRILVQVGRRIEKIVRVGDLAARFGGDEFAVLLDDVESHADALRIAERLLSVLAEPVCLSGHEISVTASAGVIFGDPARIDTAELLRDADAAMYRAKALGRNRYTVFDEAMHAEAMRTLELEADLRRAIRRREVTAAFQPVVSLASGGLWGFETLLRWRHPRYGLLPAERFVPLAEETNLVAPLTWHAVSAACHELLTVRERLGDGADLRVSVNVSPRKLHVLDFAARLEAVVRRAGVEPRHLCVEITECALANDHGHAATVLSDLAGRGFPIHLDDFGRGPASLACLRDHPIDLVKIDGALVREIERGGKAEDIVRAIVLLVRTLGMEVTAEGVESREQLRLLREMGCDNAQGFLFSPPCTGPELVEKLAEAPCSVLAPFG